MAATEPSPAIEINEVPQATSSGSASPENQAADPFASQRNEDGLFGRDAEVPKLGSSPPTSKQDKRLSTDEWDASKTPPSRFQQRKGSIYSTPSSRDGRVDRNYDRDAAYHAKLVEKGWAGKVKEKIPGRRKSAGADAGIEAGK